jgi:hypothetical protein
MAREGGERENKKSSKSSKRRDNQERMGRAGTTNHVLKAPRHKFLNISYRPILDCF